MYTLHLHTIEDGKESLIYSFNFDKIEDCRIPQKGESILYQDEVYKVVGVCTCLEDSNTIFSLMLEKIDEELNWWE